jgi:hypothetical protein
MRTRKKEALRGRGFKWVLFDMNASNMKATGWKEKYQQERDNLLTIISNQLAVDPRVKAAWLFGSLGRGDADAISDLDLWVVTEPDYVDRVRADPQACVTNFGKLILSLSAPQNAPKRGAYFMTCYDDEVAPHIVDWYWQPASEAFIPANVQLLFDKAGLARNDQPILFDDQQENLHSIEQPHHFISYFWMMLMITAKYAYRFPWAKEMELLPYLLDPLHKAQQYSGVIKNLWHYEQPHTQPVEKVQLLFSLADQMHSTMNLLSSLSTEVPEGVFEGVLRYLNFIKQLLISDGIIKTTDLS